MAGKVAIALLETPEGQQRYEKEIALRLRSGWEPVALARRVDELGRLLEPFLPAASFPGFRRELVVLKERLAERKLELERQLEEAKKPPLSFATGVERPANWVVKDIPEGGRLDRGGPGRQGKGTTLRIVAGEKTSASWRTQVFLPPGRYRWEGSVRTIGARPLVNARRQGAALRLAGSGGSSSARLTGTSPWTELSADFSVGPTPRLVELICEFVAGGGTAEFDEASLKLTKLE